MPLFVQGEILNDRCLSVKTIVERVPSLEVDAKAFRSQPAKEVQGPGLLYVIQREFATVSPSDNNVTIMGSEDATTCHIVCLRNQGTGVTSLAHFDGCGMQAAIDTMITSVIDKDLNEVDLHMFGGFLDARQLSATITHEILTLFHKLTANIHLCTLCVTDLNDVIHDNGEHYPVVYGIAINVQTGEIFHATFPDKGPECTLRHVRTIAGGHEVLKVYSSATGELQIGPFDYKFLKNAARFIEAHNQIILQYLSSSPHCEPASFCDQTRAVMKYIVKNPQPSKTVFPDGTPHRYVRNSDNVWQHLQQ